LGKTTPKGEMKMENKNRNGIYMGNNNGTIHSSYAAEPLPIKRR
jgi:hypothetical protein